MSTHNAISIDHLTVLYGAHVALMDISCAIPSGVICALVGPNGAGKSTILKVLMGLVKPLSGIIQVYGKPVNKACDMIAYVPQRSSVDWHFPISVYDVVMMGRYAKIGFLRRPRQHDHDLVLEALGTVGMVAQKNILIGALSGGQQQRVFLARALVQQAPLLLLDEPFTGIDTATERLLIKVLQQLRAQGATIIVVHHDLTMVATYADWAVLLHHTLIKAGPLSTVLTDTYLTHAYSRSLMHIVER